MVLISVGKVINFMVVEWKSVVFFIVIFIFCLNVIGIFCREYILGRSLS